jgi:sulfonate transport system substrate-binding protein
MTKAANDDYSLAVPITPAVVASEQQVANAFTASGLIPVHLSFSDFVDTSFNATAGAA